MPSTMAAMIPPAILTDSSGSVEVSQSLPPGFKLGLHWQEGPYQPAGHTHLYGFSPGPGGMLGRQVAPPKQGDNSVQ